MLGKLHKLRWILLSCVRGAFVVWVEWLTWVVLSCVWVCFKHGFWSSDSEWLLVHCGVGLSKELQTCDGQRAPVGAFHENNVNSIFSRLAAQRVQKTLCEQNWTSGRERASQRCLKICPCKNICFLNLFIMYCKKNTTNLLGSICWGPLCLNCGFVICV